MKTVLKASVLGMLAAIVVLILEWFVAVHWDISKDRKQMKRREDYSNHYTGLMRKNVARRINNIGKFVGKSLGVRSSNTRIDVNVQCADEEQTVNVKDHD